MTEKNLAKSNYIAILKALECYAYRVFLFDGRRSNAGKSRLFRMGSDLLKGNSDADDIIYSVYGLIAHYADDASFEVKMEGPANWYMSRRLLKYTLFEYELYLLEVEGKGAPPILRWEDLNDSTLEHILPQTPDKDSVWRVTWKKTEHKECLHDIGNMVLTRNNSNYKNYDFSRKKGKPGLSPSYADSDIRQERRVALYQDWTKKEFMQRREEICTWAFTRWKTPEKYMSADVLEVDDIEEETA